MDLFPTSCPLNSTPEIAAILTTSRTLARLPGLAALLGHPILHYRRCQDYSQCASVIAWGRKPSAIKAQNFATQHGLPLIQLEDGFLRSVGLGNQDPPLSIVVDDLGIYYDATAASKLEILIAEPLNALAQQRAQHLINAWRAARISKYNHLRDTNEIPSQPYVLVADQVFGDTSIAYGLASQASFQSMLSAALTEHPDCTIVLKIHPDVMHGRKKGHFDLKALANEPRVLVLAENRHPVSLIEHAQAIYCVTSQIGFEGLLWGKSVRTFGMPFYAGWGLTDDDLTRPVRRKNAPLENLVHAALVTYPRYLDPETGEHCTPERLIAWMALQRQMRARFPETIEAQGFSFTKKPVVRRFFQGSTVYFNRSASLLRQDATYAVWGRKAMIQPANPAHTIHLEDGFLRSVGLGADLIHPLSWAMDRRGIYYDAGSVSDLEQILQNTEFDKVLLARAEALRTRLVGAGLTKYNVGLSEWQKPDLKSLVKNSEPAHRIILVPGQVEADASLQYGAPDICKNLDLLKAVRAANPQAYIIYKPHPDVIAGLRHKGQEEDQAEHWCNEQVLDVAMATLLAEVDEIHTMTSLTGFEALLRNKTVVCYGQPFYAGWGLTTDILPLARRTRKLSLDELVGGVLILYPTYVSRTTGKFTTPERVLDELLAWRGQAASLPAWRKALRWLLQMEMWVKHVLS